jgi:hypothetical protein
MSIEALAGEHSTDVVHGYSASIPFDRSFYCNWKQDENATSRHNANICPLWSLADRYVFETAQHDSGVANCCEHMPNCSMRAQP